MTVRMTFCGVAALLLAGSVSAVPPAQTLVGGMHHLRWGTVREWDEFPLKPESTGLELTFDSTPNQAERTLRLRHRDLRQAWEVWLNDKKLFTLPRDEPESVTCWAIPPGSLREKANTLRIACAAKPPDAAATAAGAPVSDDVMIGDVEVIDLPRAAVLSEAVVSVSVLADETGLACPSRITVTDERGALVDLGNKSDSHHAVRTGVVYAGTGKADLLLAAGRYTIYAGRGFEYSLPSATLDVRPGDKVQQTFRLRRVVPTEGWVASDPHVHTFTFSRHGDATIEERLLTLAGEGIELPIATDHNLNIDYTDAARGTQTAPYLTPVTGNEVTTRIGHFNAFPMAKDGPLPDWRASTWGRIAESVAKARVGEQAVIILNHGRDIHAGFRPFDPVRHISPTGENLDGWDLPANAMEVINSGATLSEPMQLYRDWFGLLNRGKQITPIGSSDCHDVNRFIVGQARTYVKMRDADAGRLSSADAVHAFNEGRVLVSYGLIADLTVDGKFGPGDLVPAGAVDDLKLSVRVLGPEWTRAARVTLFVNGVAVRTDPITQPADKPEPAGLKYAATWTLPRPKHDVWLTVIAEGPGVTGAYWPAAKPYQATTSAWTPYVMGSCGAIRIDADESGTFDSAMAHATKIATAAGDDTAAAIKALKAMEATDGISTQAVAAQLAGLWRAQNPDTFVARIESQRAEASPAATRGFDEFIAAWNQSARARAAARQ